MAQMRQKAYDTPYSMADIYNAGRGLFAPFYQVPEIDFDKSVAKARAVDDQDRAYAQRDQEREALQNADTASQAFKLIEDVRKKTGDVEGYLKAREAADSLEIEDQLGQMAAEGKSFNELVPEARKAFLLKNQIDRAMRLHPDYPRFQKVGKDLYAVDPETGELSMRVDGPDGQRDRAIDRPLYKNYYNDKGEKRMVDEHDPADVKAAIGAGYDSHKPGAGAEDVQALVRILGGGRQEESKASDGSSESESRGPSITDRASSLTNDLRQGIFGKDAPSSSRPGPGLRRQKQVDLDTGKIRYVYK